MEMPTLAKIMVATSTPVLCRMAEMIPSGTPIRIARISPPTASSMVIGRRSTKIWLTGRLKRIELPKSPLQDAGHIETELHVDRPVEPVLPRETLADALGGRLLAEDRPARIAGDRAGRARR